MFSTEFLHVVREYEISEIVRHFAPGTRVLEIGGGTGYQARQLADRGFKVASIDVSTSNYRNGRVFPVIDYDGRIFPFKDQSFDIVFSSNALEHIVDLATIHRESRRVLKLNGYCVHVMPTAAWRFWTGIANYVELLQRLCSLTLSVLPRYPGWSDFKQAAIKFWSMMQLIRAYSIPPRHGETGNVMTELWTFSRRHWIADFQRHNFLVVCAQPMNLFYTGHMILGPQWSMRSRKRMAALLGSACVLYKVKIVTPGDEPSVK